MASLSAWIPYTIKPHKLVLDLGNDEATIGACRGIRITVNLKLNLHNKTAEEQSQGSLRANNISVNWHPAHEIATGQEAVRTRHVGKPRSPSPPFGPPNFVTQIPK